MLLQVATEPNIFVEDCAEREFTDKNMKSSSRGWDATGSGVWVGKFLRCLLISKKMQGFVNIYCKKMYLYAETGTTVEASSNTWMAW